MKPRLPADGLWFGLTIAASLVLGTFLAVGRSTDPFLFFDTSFVSSQLAGAQMAIPETGPYASLSFVPGREMLLITLCNMLGVNPGILQFLPVGIVLVAAVLFQFLRDLLGSGRIAAAGTLYLTLNLSHASAYYSVFAYAFALPIFLGAAWLGLRMFEDRSARGIIALFLLFLGAELIHYTFAAWVVLMLAGGTVVLWLRGQRTGARTPGMPYLTAAIAALFLAFNEVIYKSFLPLAGPQALATGLDRLLGLLSLAPVSDIGGEYRYERDLASSLVSGIAVALAFIPVFVWTVRPLVVAARRRATHVSVPSTEMVLVAGIVSVGVADALSYSFRGSISTKAISLLFPIAGLALAGSVGGRRLRAGLAVALLATTVAKLGVFYASGYVIGPGSEGVSLDQAATARTWMQQHVQTAAPSVVANMSLYGKILLAAPDPPQPALEGFTTDRMARVVGASPGVWPDRPNLVLVDTLSTQPTLGFVFLSFRALRDFLPEIRANPATNILYDSGSLVILQPLSGPP